MVVLHLLQMIVYSGKEFVGDDTYVVLTKVFLLMDVADTADGHTG